MFNRNISDEEKASLKLDLAEISAERDSLTIINEKLQVNLCQKLLFLHQITHNMTTDCSLS